MKLITEVAFIRPILIFLLVIYHAFDIYAGGWIQPEGYVDIPMYKDIAILSYSCMLETFVFISGYIFFWGVIKANKSCDLKTIVKSKFKRLLIPAWVWSCLYYCVIDNTDSFKDIILMGGGIGHMWFLPMLFWCFIIGWYFLKSQFSKKTKIALSIALCLVSWLPLPFRMSSALYYQFYFILGYYLIFKREDIVKFFTPLRLTYLWLIYVVILILHLTYGDCVIQIPHNTMLEKMLFFSVKNLQRLIISLAGVTTLYATALSYTSIYTLSEAVVTFGTSCFGIYIFQQFILKLLYYQTSLPDTVGPYWLPWVSVLITLVISWCLTIILRRNKLMRHIL